jgi:hypothetical protein
MQTLIITIITVAAILLILIGIGQKMSKEKESQRQIYQDALRKKLFDEARRQIGTGQVKSIVDFMQGAEAAQQIIENE